MSCKTLLIFVCMVSYHAACAAGNGSESRVVSTEQGPVRGYKDAQYDLFVFYNIPYARTPTGRDKFKAPLPPLQRTEIFEAEDEYVICPQSLIGNFYDLSEKVMQEDCLITNIYVPDTNETNLPVMVYIHGGAYGYGFGDYIIPKGLVQSKKMIAVNFNYRLGAHGFLCLGTEGAPGNAGLKDQVAFLRWLRANIANFGGNPDDVTIGGCSAGASSVDLLAISRAANGLFNKVIVSSAAHLSVFAVQMDPIYNAKEGARVLNFTNVDDFEALEEFYLNAPIDVISYPEIPSNLDGSLHFVPCVEKDLGTERILEDAPYNILRNGTFTQFPMLYGFTEMEGMLMSISDFTSSINLMNENFQIFLPANLQFDNEEQRREVAESIKEFYFEGRNVSSESILQYIDYYSDVSFVYSMLQSVKLRAEAGNSSIYLYEYSFVDLNSPIVPGTNVHAAVHCAQEEAVFDEDETNLTEEYKNMKVIMREIFLNFITTGIPASPNSSITSWPTAGANRFPYMQLNLSLQVHNSQLLQERARLWDEVYERHNRVPIPPSVPDSAVLHFIQTKWIVCLLAVQFRSYLTF